VGFIATNRNGAMERDPSPERLDDLVRELDGPEDIEHGDVSVAHESGWALSAFPSGLVIWQNLEERAPERRVEAVTRDQVRRLFDGVARGDFAFVESSLDEAESGLNP
jgi:hypothetical protein